MIIVAEASTKRKELSEIEDQLEAESAYKGGWHGCVEMFQGPRMPYRIFLGIVLQALQQLTGAHYFFYGTVVFNGAGIKNTYVTQLILGVVNFGTTFGGLYAIEHFQRRKSLIIEGIWIFLLSSIHRGIPRGPRHWPRLRTGFEDFLIGFLTPFITDDIDFAYGYVFAGCLFAGVLIVYFCVLEGKGKTLEERQDVC
ncbi:hypothetical protein CNMCM5623_003286 [Aspergillus felis]|uniref:Uncharacterized protein n=1 Tax=Aspergillus felis TaxID=1287682 RepID=A0A8H6VA53_9EURO|nr:hypothetical protein CNMCM5623_003286 [Aspergillus felis]KAF7183222.1 hypothetical protein CNMCM7691_003135 [Aspergillus felis]